MKFKLLIIVGSFSVLVTGAEAALVAAFDFQTTTNGGTAAVASTTSAPSPLVYQANFGSAVLYLDGSNGSSEFVSGVSNPEVTSFAGSAINTSGTSLSTTTSGAASLAIANSSANTKAAVFVFSMAGHEGLSISYATQRTATGFNSQLWEYSLDGITYETIQNVDSIATSFALVTLPTIAALDNAATAYIRVTFDGATAAAGNNRLDNIQFNSIPEPATALCGAVGFLGLFRRRR